MWPQDLTRAETLAKISVVSNTAGGRRAWHADPQVLTIAPTGKAFDVEFGQTTSGTATGSS